MSRGMLLMAGLLAALGPVLCSCDGESDGHDYAGLDTNGDGKLDPEDIEAGESAVYVVFHSETDEIEVGWVADDGEISPAGGDEYYLRMTLEHEGTYDLTVRFQNFDPMAVGNGPITHATMTQETGWYAHDSESDGRLELTDVSEVRVSGYFDGHIQLEAIDEQEQPTGEVVIIEALAFDSVDYVEYE